MKKIIFILLFFSLTKITSIFAGVLYLGPTLMYQNTYKNNIRYEELSPKFSVGYGEMLYKSLYLAGEVNAHLRGLRINNHAHDAINLKTKYSFGMSLIPGFLLDPYLMAYARAGLVYTYFDQISSTKKGWQVGGGLQMYINPDWDIRAEYDYTQYSRLPELGSLRADEFSLGGVYRIA